MHRKVMKDWTLSDGTIIPAGTMVAIASGPMNMDEVRLLGHIIIQSVTKIGRGLFLIVILSMGSDILKNEMAMVNWTASNIKWSLSVSI
jgi:hypothetical protein